MPYHLLDLYQYFEIWSMIKNFKVLIDKLILTTVFLCKANTTWFSFDVTDRPRVTDEPGKLPVDYYRWTFCLNFKLIKNLLLSFVTE